MKKGFKKLTKKTLGLLVAILMLVSTFISPITVLAWTITPDADSTGLHMQIQSNGYLYWDAVPEETSGYSIAICDTIGYNCKWFNASTNSYNIIPEFDNMKKDSNHYRIEVHTKGTSEPDTYDNMDYYYTSPYDKLESPTNVRWTSENIVAWDLVPHATSYKVVVFDQYGSVGENIETDTPAVNLTANGFTIHDRLWVKVFAYASGYRTSEGAESPMHGGRDTAPIPDPTTWTVTYDSNGGSGTMSSDTDLEDGSTFTLPTTTTFEAPTNKQFKGWSLTSDGAIITTVEMTENRTVYAIWEDIPTTYTINVVAIPGEGGTVSVTTDQGGGIATENTQVTINALPNEGYEFVAWKLSSPAASDNFATSASYSFDATESVWLYAIFQEQSAPEPDTWTVTFNSKGGSDVPSQTGIANNGTATQPANPTRTGTGYTFGGWYLDEDCITTPFDFSTPITANITVYAKWIPTEITEVSATVTLPVAGQHPVLTGTPGNSTYSILSVNFYDKDSHQLTTSDTFEAGETYDIYVSYRPVSGYTIPNEATATVNSETATFQGAISDGYGTIVYKLNYTVPAVAPTYTIIEGDNQTYTKGSNENIVIKASGDVSKISSIEIDGGNVIDPANYELTSGSTVLTLKSSFLENSSVGTHTITFKYNDGEVDATLIVAEATNNDNNNNNGNNTGNNTNENTNGDTTNNGNSTTSNNPHTADNIVAYVYELILSIIVVAGGMIYIKRKKVFGNK